jgi:hypothetical protein
MALRTASALSPYASESTGYVAVDELRKDRENALVSIESDVIRLENLIKAIRAKAAALDLTAPLDEMPKQSAILRASLGLRAQKSKHAA